MSPLLGTHLAAVKGLACFVDASGYASCIYLLADTIMLARQSQRSQTKDSQLCPVAGD